jgi:hypothetical protein
MVAFAVPFVIGAGLTIKEILGSQRTRREAEEEEAAGEQSSLDQLSVLTSGGALRPGQEGPPTPERLLASFTERQQRELSVVSANDPGAAVTMAQNMLIQNEAAKQQIIDNQTGAAELQLKQQNFRLKQKEFDIDLQNTIIETQRTAQQKADDAQALIDPKFALEQFPDKDTYQTWDPLRQTFTTAFKPGTPTFKLSEKEITSTTQGLQDANELRALVREFQLSGDPAQLSGQRANSLVSSLQLSLANSLQLKPISEGDIEAFLIKLVPDVTSLKAAILQNPEAINAGLIQLTTEILRANTRALENVSGWEGIRDELITDAADARVTARAQNVRSRAEIQAQADRQQQVEALGFGASSIDDRFAALGVQQLTSAEDTETARQRFRDAQAIGFDPPLFGGGAAARQAGAIGLENAGLVGGLLTALTALRFGGISLGRR